MAMLAEIMAELEQTEEALVRTEREMRSSPEDRSLRLIRASLEKRKHELANQLARAQGQAAIEATGDVMTRGH
jgi:hypothetical protein